MHLAILAVRLSRRLRRVWLGVFTTLLAVPLAQAESQPLWDAGIGAAVIDFPDYRGADERQTLLLPFPYFNYRGERLKVDRQGVRGLLVDTNRIEIDVSMNATPPVRSRNNQARDGMENLDPTIEAGPSLKIKLAHDTARQWAVELRLPLRASIALDFSRLHYAGLVFQPHLALDFNDVHGWKVGFTSGAVFGDQRQHQYFYGVPAQFATSTRPAYEAKGGYGGAYVLAAARRRFDRLWVATFLRMDTLKGAAFENSPLARSDHAVYAGIAFAWIFWESKERVESKGE